MPEFKHPSTPTVSNLLSAAAQAAAYPLPMRMSPARSSSVTGAEGRQLPAPPIDRIRKRNVSPPTTVSPPPRGAVRQLPPGYGLEPEAGRRSPPAPWPDDGSTQLPPDRGASVQWRERCLELEQRLATQARTPPRTESRRRTQHDQLPPDREASMHWRERYLELEQRLASRARTSSPRAEDPRQQLPPERDGGLHWRERYFELEQRLGARVPTPPRAEDPRQQELDAWRDRCNELVASLEQRLGAQERADDRLRDIELWRGRCQELQQRLDFQQRADESRHRDAEAMREKCFELEQRLSAQELVDEPRRREMEVLRNRCLALEQQLLERGNEANENARREVNIWRERCTGLELRLGKMEEAEEPRRREVEHWMGQCADLERRLEVTSQGDHAMGKLVSSLERLNAVASAVARVAQQYELGYPRPP
eukprot:Hpha_TRINITY_DN26018_c0_g1::TRINITY_DN26018_c0_g1_i1::g.115222::m.115222